MIKWSLVASLAVVFGCSSGLSGERTQKPLIELGEETDVALVSVDVAPWVEGEAVEKYEPTAIIRQILPRALEDTPLNVVDRIESGAGFDVYANAEPHILDTASFEATRGHPYRYGANNHAQAHGAHPLKWEAVEAPPEFEIDEATGEIYWVPAELGQFSIILEATNDMGTGRYRFDVTVGDEEVDYEARTPEDSPVFATQSYRSDGPGEVPSSVQEPLLLSVKVLRWEESIFYREPHEHSSSPPSESLRAHTDLVYSLWTRDGVEIDTQRVRYTTKLGRGRLGTPALIPGWPYWYYDDWTRSSRTRPDITHHDRDRMFENATMGSGMRFGYPFTERIAPLEVEVLEYPGMDEGIEFMEDENWEAARDFFRRRAEEESHRIGEMTARDEKERQHKGAALYNKGLAAEFQGEDEEAMEFYIRAYEASGHAVVSERMHVVERRLDDYVDVNSKVAQAREALEAQIAAEQENSGDGSEENDEDPSLDPEEKSEEPSG